MPRTIRSAKPAGVELKVLINLLEDPKCARNKANNAPNFPFRYREEPTEREGFKFVFSAAQQSSQ